MVVLRVDEFIRNVLIFSSIFVSHSHIEINLVHLRFGQLKDAESELEISSFQRSSIVHELAQRSFISVKCANSLVTSSLLPYAHLVVKFF